MATFSYDQNSSDNINAQWNNYLKSNINVYDKEGIITQNQQEYISLFKHLSDEQKNACQKVCGNLDVDFYEINKYIDELRIYSYPYGEIDNTPSMIDWKHSMIIEEQHIKHFINDLSQYLHIIESDNHRINSIRDGLEHLIHAFKEGIDSISYSLALEYFQDSGKNKEKDFVTLNSIGLIHLYSTKHRDFQLAEKYFLKSAGYALELANTHESAKSYNYTIDGYLLKISDQNPYKKASFESYLYASRACYLQQKLTAAADLAGIANSLIPEYLEGGFQKAKYLAANNQAKAAAIILEEIINRDRFYSLKALKDLDLCSKQAILALFNDLHLKVILKAKSKLDECLSQISPNSKAFEKICEIEKEVQRNCFLSGSRALDLLNSKYSFPVNIISRSEYSGINKDLKTDSLYLIDYINIDNFNRKRFDELQHLINKEICSSVKLPQFQELIILLKNF